MIDKKFSLDIKLYFDHTYECLEVEIAWNSGEMALKSVFYANFPLV